MSETEYDECEDCPLVHLAVCGNKLTDAVENRLDHLANELSWFRQFAVQDDWFDRSIVGTFGCAPKVQFEIMSYLGHLEKQGKREEQP